MAGVNKAIQTISVFVASAIFFGPEHPEQRMTGFKIVALILVVIGVLIYSAAPKAEATASSNIEVSSAKPSVSSGDTTDIDIEMSTKVGFSKPGKLSQRGKGGYKLVESVDSVHYSLSLRN